MAWSYRKRIKIIPGVHLNLSKRGISTSIGVKGASLNFGSSGTRLTTSFLGFSNSHKISGANVKKSSGTHPFIDPKPAVNVGVSDNIFSADLQEITPQDMEGIKECILVAQNQKAELQNDLKKIKKALVFSNIKKVVSYILIYGIFSKNILQKINQDIFTQKQAIKATEIEIVNSVLNIDVEFEDSIKTKYERLLKTFNNLNTSKCIWDVTGSFLQDYAAARSNASTLVNRKEVKLGIKALSLIKCKYEALYFQNINGPDLYFYPTFILMYSNNQKFAIIGINELTLITSAINFTETNAIPIDSKVIGNTWAKVNKNGTPDKRFKNNYKIPLVQYGTMHLSTSTGLNEEYHISNLEFSDDFGNAFEEYKSICRNF